LAAPPEGREDEAKRALRGLADDPAPEVRAAALSSLGQLGDTEAFEVVLARFDDGDATVRQIALIAIGELRDARALPALMDALRDPRPEVRYQAVASLAMVDPDGAADVLGRCVVDEDAEVRSQLAEVLGSLERGDSATALGILLEDPEREVRQGAAIALARIGDGRGVGALIEALDDRERCFEAAWALGELGAARARDPLARVAQSFLKPLAVKAAAAAALVRLSDPRGEPALKAVLSAFRSDARSYAAQLVGELRLASLAPEVVALTRRPRGADPMVVVEALVKLAEVSADARAELERLAGDEGEVGEVARGWRRRAEP
jgi:HEAT repeat protein